MPRGGPRPGAGRKPERTEAEILAALVLGARLESARIDDGEAEFNAAPIVQRVEALKQRLRALGLTGVDFVQAMEHGAAIIRAEESPPPARVRVKRRYYTRANGDPVAGLLDAAKAAAKKPRVSAGIKKQAQDEWREFLTWEAKLDAAEVIDRGFDPDSLQAVGEFVAWILSGPNIDPEALEAARSDAA